MKSERSLEYSSGINKSCKVKESVNFTNDYFKKVIEKEDKKISNVPILLYVKSILSEALENSNENCFYLNEDDTITEIELKFLKCNFINKICKGINILMKENSIFFKWGYVKIFFKRLIYHSNRKMISNRISNIDDSNNSFNIIYTVSTDEMEKIKLDKLNQKYHVLTFHKYCSIAKRNSYECNNEIGEILILVENNENFKEDIEVFVKFRDRISKLENYSDYNRILNLECFMKTNKIYIVDSSITQCFLRALDIFYKGSSRCLEKILCDSDGNLSEISNSSNQKLYVNLVFINDSNGENFNTPNNSIFELMNEQNKCNIFSYNEADNSSGLNLFILNQEKILKNTTQMLEVIKQYNDKSDDETLFSQRNKNRKKKESNDLDDGIKSYLRELKNLPSIDIKSTNIENFFFDRHFSSTANNIKEASREDSYKKLYELLICNYIRFSYFYKFRLDVQSLAKTEIIEKINSFIFCELIKYSVSKKIVKCLFDEDLAENDTVNLNFTKKEKKLRTPNNIKETSFEALFNDNKLNDDELDSIINNDLEEKLNEINKEIIPKPNYYKNLKAESIKNIIPNDEIKIVQYIINSECSFTIVDKNIDKEKELIKENVVKNEENIPNVNDITFAEINCKNIPDIKKDNIESIETQSFEICEKEKNHEEINLINPIEITEIILDNPSIKSTNKIQKESVKSKKAIFKSVKHSSTSCKDSSSSELVLKNKLLNNKREIQRVNRYEKIELENDIDKLISNNKKERKSKKDKHAKVINIEVNEDCLSSTYSISNEFIIPIKNNPNRIIHDEELSETTLTMQKTDNNQVNNNNNNIIIQNNLNNSTIDLVSNSESNSNSLTLNEEIPKPKIQKNWNSSNSNLDQNNSGDEKSKNKKLKFIKKKMNENECKVIENNNYNNDYNKKNNIIYNNKTENLNKQNHHKYEKQNEKIKLSNKFKQVNLANRFDKINENNNNKFSQLSKTTLSQYINNKEDNLVEIIEDFIVNDCIVTNSNFSSYIDRISNMLENNRFNTNIRTIIFKYICKYGAGDTSKHETCVDQIIKLFHKDIMVRIYSKPEFKEVKIFLAQSKKFKGDGINESEIEYLIKHSDLFNDICTSFLKEYNKQKEQLPTILLISKYIGMIMYILKCYKSKHDFNKFSLKFFVGNLKIDDLSQIKLNIMFFLKLKLMSNKLKNKSKEYIMITKNILFTIHQSESFVKNELILKKSIEKIQSSITMDIDENISIIQENSGLNNDSSNINNMNKIISQTSENNDAINTKTTNSNILNNTNSVISSMNINTNNNTNITMKESIMKGLDLKNNYYLVKNSNPYHVNYFNKTHLLRTDYVKAIIKIISEIGLNYSESIYKTQYKFNFVYNRIFIDLYNVHSKYFYFDRKIINIIASKPNDLLTHLKDKDKEKPVKFIRVNEAALLMFHNFCIGYDDYIKITDEQIYKRIEVVIDKLSFIYFGFSLFKRKENTVN